MTWEFYVFNNLGKCIAGGVAPSKELAEEEVNYYKSELDVSAHLVKPQFLGVLENV